jgi:hypothetical protein
VVVTTGPAERDAPVRAAACGVASRPAFLAIRNVPASGEASLVVVQAEGDHPASGPARRDLHLGEPTVKTHVGRMLAKTGSTRGS